jgi:hypothetical protein
MSFLFGDDAVCELLDQELILILVNLKLRECHIKLCQLVQVT